MPRSFVRNDHESGAVVHPAFTPQLAHARVDERVPHVPLTPGHKSLLGVTPLDLSAVARLELWGGVAGEMEEDVVVEVAPAELAAEGGGPAIRPQPVLDLACGHAAEMQVGRQPRGGTAAERVTVLAVPRNIMREEPLEPLAPLMLTALGGSSTSCSRPSEARDGISPLARPDGSAGSWRRAQHFAPALSPTNDGTRRRPSRACPPAGAVHWMGRQRPTGVVSALKPHVHERSGGICAPRLNTPAGATSCTRPRPTDSGLPAQRVYTRSSAPASRQKHSYAPPRRGALTMRATARRVPGDTTTGRTPAKT